ERTADGHLLAQLALDEPLPRRQTHIGNRRANLFCGGPAHPRRLPDGSENRAGGGFALHGGAARHRGAIRVDCRTILRYDAAMASDEMTHEERLAEGTRIRREVLGAEYVDR